MIQKYFLLLSVLLSTSTFASGNYKTQTSSASEPKLLPYEKTEESFVDYVYGIDRKNVSLHEVKIDGKTFKIKGNYTNDIDFASFVEKLKGNGEVDRKIEITKVKDGLRGSSSDAFEIKGVNIWK